ncbi:Basal-body rod modification protein FlgD [Pseudobythopirellula maris]|uniref:Basal-body rod modification protein FlgD n=1 Tax=Pseudobythopirellula maris TaxID=2527991 RepID=A0A5C5ZH18_9BACT|nr:flagellar hook capping FlgD N-terminal domain-containing protein [Pseudobythopirellula maris]TWT86516.1 Basal-body rod modification protein FlgD [Pseudobythopirellula maris]
MSSITNNLGGVTDASSNSRPSAVDDLDLDVFLELMISELQNQDPLNPLENDELLAQISQIREIASNDQLTNTLESVLLGQNVTTATSLIGADVVALDENGQRVRGNVQRVTINDGQPNLDLSLSAAASAGEEEGSLESGNYVYEVVWETSDGTPFGQEIGVSTSTFSDFNGTVRLDNLPETTVRKSIYRTDNTGQGSRQLIGRVNGEVTSLVDGTPDSELGEHLTVATQKVSFGRKVTVDLDTVAQIEPPQ